MQEKVEYGAFREKRAYYDLQQVVMVYVGQSKRDAGNRMLNLLLELFKSNDSAVVKLRTLKENYDINLTQSVEGMVDTMCNLSVGVFERGWNSAWNKSEEVKNRKVIINLLKMHVDMPIIVSATESTEEYVRQVAEEEHLLIKE